MTEELSNALEATDAELYDAIFDGLLRLIVEYVPFGMLKRDSRCDLRCGTLCACLQRRSTRAFPNTLTSRMTAARRRANGIR